MGEGADGLAEALARVADEAGQAIDDGFDYIVLSDRHAGGCVLCWWQALLGAAAARERRGLRAELAVLNEQPTGTPLSRRSPLQAATAWRCRA